MKFIFLMEQDHNTFCSFRNTPKDLFDAWAMQGKDEEFAAGNATYREFIQKHLTFPTTPFEYLELGCSNGWGVRLVAEKHPQCTTAVGVDISPRMIWKAQHCWPNPSNVSFVASDLMDYNPPSKFDFVYSFAVLYYIVPMETMKTKLSNWLKPGGMFIAGTDYYTENSNCHGWSDMMAIDMDLRTKAQWKELFENGFGLNNVSQLEINYPNAQENESPTLFTIGYL